MLKFLGFLFILTVVVGGLALYSYSKVESRLISVDSVEPSFKADLGSIVSAGIQFLSGNLLGAAAQFIEGAQVNATVEIHNGGLIPIYLPEMEHYIRLEGQSSATRPTTTQSMWLMPGESKTVSVGTLIPVSDIPRVALNALTQGSDLKVDVESRFELAGFTISRQSGSTGKATQSIQQRVQQEQAPITELRTQTPTPSRVSTATPTPTPRPVPTRTPTPTATPRIGSLLPTPAPTSRIDLTITQVKILDDHDPSLAGNGEIYFIIALGDGFNLRWQRLPEFPRHFSVSDGAVLQLNLTSTLSFKPRELDIYIGVWEADDDACFKAWAQDRPNPVSGISKEFAVAVEGLEACGDDLVGAATGQWLEADNWGKGEHTVTMQDAIVDFTIVPN